MRRLAIGLAALTVFALVVMFALAYAAIIDLGDSPRLCDAALLTFCLALAAGAASFTAFLLGEGWGP